MKTEELIKDDLFASYDENQKLQIADLVSAKEKELEEKYKKTMAQHESLIKNNVVDELKEKLKDKGHDLSKLLSEEKKENKKEIEKDNDIQKPRTSVKDEKEIRDLVDELSHLRTAHVQLKEKHDKLERALSEQETKVKIRDKFNEIVGEVDFKGSYPKKIQDLLISNVRRDIFDKYNAEFEGDEMIFRDSFGHIARNKNNMMSPYTLRELIHERLDEYISESKKHKVNPASGAFNSVNSEVPDATRFKTQLEANKIYGNYLNTRGLERGTKEFSDKMTEFFRKHNIINLPIK